MAHLVEHKMFMWIRHSFVLYSLEGGSVRFDSYLFRVMVIVNYHAQCITP